MKKISVLFFSFLIVVGAVLLLSGYGLSAPKAPKEIRVGCVASVTGMFAGMADGGVFGLQAAFDDINKQGGVLVKEYGRKIPMKLIVVDSESDPAKTGLLAESLVVQEKVQFLVCHNEPPQVHAPVARIAAKHKIPHLADVAVMEPWLGMRQDASPPFDYTWALGFAIVTPGPPGYTILDTWKEELDKYGDKTNKKVGVFATDEPDGAAWYTIFPQAMKEWGYEVVGVEKKLGLFPIDTTDFSTIIQQWKQAGVEILWGNAPAPVFGALLKQARAMGFEPKIISAGRAALYYTDVMAWGSDLANGVGTETFWSPGTKSYAAIGNTTPATLLERWQKGKKRPFNVAMVLGYQVAQVLVDSIQRAGTLNADQVSKAIGETDMMTMCDRVKFDQKTHFARIPVVFGQWQKTDKPWVWECPVVFSKHKSLPTTGKFLFPIPYK